MNGLTVDTYWPLLLLLIIPYFWWIQGKTLTDLSPKHLRLSGSVRSAIVALLALALMQPTLYRSSDWISVVYLLDISQSVAPAAIQSAIEWIQKTNDEGRPAQARFIPFAANSTVLNNVDQLKKVEVANKSVQRAIDQTGTGIEGAVDSAIHTFAPHHLKRLVLITDGNENAGHMMNVVSRLKQENIHVYTQPLQARANRDVWVETIMAPSEVPTEELFPVEAHVYSQTETPADCRREVRR